MKRIGVAIAAVSVIVLVCGVAVLRGQGAAGPEAKAEKRTISTSGQATIKVKPDSARVYFGVQTLAETIKKARADNAASVKKVMDALTALQIPDLKMKSSDVHVELVQSAHDRDSLPRTLGYKVTHTFTVLVQNEDAQKLSGVASRVLDTALENGANIVQQISFFKKDQTEVRRQAMSKAVEDAVANAQALAAGGKVKLADTVTISGEPAYHYFGGQLAQTNATFVGGVGGEDTPIVAGDLEVTCRVSISCTY